MSDLPYFIFKGINSYDRGIYLIDLPITYKPARNIETVEIVGRNGFLHKDTGTYQSYNIVINCTLSKLHNTPITIDELVTWLNGSGELILSTEPTKKYKAFLNDSFSLSPILDVFTEFSLNFEVYPYKFSNSLDKDLLVVNKPTTVHNLGTLISLPAITVFGSGNGSIFINNTEYQLQNITSGMVIDSELQNIYKDNQNKNDSFLSFDFPTIPIGNSEIRFNGGITKLEIEPNWVWL